jgi:predicted metal-dependent peptidase
MSEVFLIAIIAHESYHCAYRHHLRMGGRDLEGWNKATDYVINYDLIEAGFKLPEWVLHDKKYKGYSSEEVYNMLPKPPKQPDQSKGKGKGGGGGQTPGNSSGDGSGQPMPSSAPDPGRMGGIISPCLPWDKAAIEKENARWESLAKQAAAIAKAANAGSMPSFLKRLIDDLGKPRVAWQTVLSNFVDTTSEDEFNWSKLNRRFISKGYKLPTLHSEKVRRIVAEVDTSGSVTGKILDRYAAELSSFLDMGLADVLTVLYADVVVHNIQHFERGDNVKLDPQGGGGTNFRDVMNKIKEYDDMSVSLFFTDLYTMDFGDEPDCPHCWVVYGNPEVYKNVQVPYGEVIFIPMDN